MESTTTNVTGHRRSSLKNPQQDLHRMSEIKRKSIKFLDTILEEDKKIEEVKEDNFSKHRRESLKNEYAMAKEMLAKKHDEDEDEIDCDETVRKNTEHNKHIDEEEEDSDSEQSKNSENK